MSELKIGVTGTVARSIYGVSVKYMEWAKQFGKVEVLMPDSKVDHLDLIVMQGGADVSPMAYGQVPSFATGKGNPHLEFFDKHVLPKAIENKIPVFGICRGMQALNVALGGTMKQHIVGHPTNKDDREELVHEVRTSNELPCIKFETNSIHHQCLDNIGEGLSVVAHSEHGVPEAIEHSTLPIAGVQWHPEEIYDNFSRDLVYKLLKK